LEFPAGGDQGVNVNLGWNKPDRHEKHDYYSPYSKPHYDLKEKKKPVWGSAGGFYKRFHPPPARPQAPPPAELHRNKVNTFALSK